MPDPAPDARSGDPRRQRIESICLAALEHQGNAESAFVREACAGDAALCAEVESLLAHASAGDRFLETSVGSLVALRQCGLRAAAVGRPGNMWVMDAVPPSP